MDSLQPNVGQALDFLQSLKDQGKGYSTINSARAALSSVIILRSGDSFGNLPLVKKFMRGIYNLAPPQPRYKAIWDPGEVLNFLVKWSPARRIKLLQLSMKVAVLILLVSGQRIQTLRALRVDRMDIGSGSIKFTIKAEDVKQGRPGYSPEPIVLKSFPADKRLCVVNYVKVYLERTLDNRGKCQRLLLTAAKPFREASKDTMARWVKTVLHKAGIDIGKFGPGSIRAASTSKAKEQGATIDDILRAGGWSRRSTFQKFYDKKIVKTKSLGDYVLNSSK